MSAQKKVRFNLPPVSFVYRMDYDRKSEWEQVARDRVRFANRIKNVEKIITDVLLNKIKQM